MALGNDPRKALPLNPLTFHILMVLLDQERHGYSIVKEVEKRTPDEFRIEPGNLYRTLRSMLQKGLIQECEERPDPEMDDQRRRYFQISKFGLQVARAETERLECLLAEARNYRILTQQT